MINIVTSFFNKNKYGNYSDDLIKQRNEEYNTCLLYNLKHDNIEKLHLFVEDKHSLNILNNILENNSQFKNKVNIILFNKQPLYSDFFKYSNENLKNKIVMITNSDIYLENSNNDILINYIKKKNNVFCLTRHEYDNNNYLIDKYCCSHDSFIFQSPLNNDIIEKSNFYQNIEGSENLIIFLLFKNNYKLFNPCFQFKIKHLHKSGVRCYKDNRINNTSYMKDYKTIWIKPCTI